MLNDFIGGGQVFLHKIRMFMQVTDRSFSVAFIIGLLITGTLNYSAIKKVNYQDAFIYFEAYTYVGANAALSGFKHAESKNYGANENMIKIYSKDRSPSYMSAHYIIKNNHYISAKNKALSFGFYMLIYLLYTCFGILVLIFVLWSRLGIGVRKDKHISGSEIKTAKEVARYLSAEKKASGIKVGDMPLVKDSETRHILITGATGSGKTNLINTILPHVIKLKQPCIIVDQTGEMISRYYDPLRGDIIFNPLDSRSHTWNFFKDIGIDEVANYNSTAKADLEKFAKVLFNFGKSASSHADPFWSNSAEAVFCACVESLMRRRDSTCNIKELQKMLTRVPTNELKVILTNTEASRYMDDNNKNTAASILSVMAAATKPLNYLYESNKSFSLKDHFDRIKKGSSAILFFSSPPSSREAIIPLISCLFELAVSSLVNIGINEQRRLWFVIDELASLGKLGGLNTLLNEGRKYGACTIASTQSASQLFEIYGHYLGNSLFTQFATKFFFRNDEPLMTKVITDILALFINR